jgi:hypothetical protein
LDYVSATKFRQGDFARLWLRDDFVAHFNGNLHRCNDYGLFELHNDNFELADERDDDGQVAFNGLGFPHYFHLGSFRFPTFGCGSNYASP